MGSVHPSAVVGDAPEHRDWHDGVMQKPAVHPSATLNAYVTVDAGIERPTRIGARCLLMKHVHVGHDAEVGADCELAPGAVICGYAMLGRGVRVGVNASILPYRKVGDGARVGAGAVVTKDVPPGMVVVGNPARPLERRATYDGTP